MYASNAAPTACGGDGDAGEGAGGPSLHSEHAMHAFSDAWEINGLGRASIPAGMPPFQLAQALILQAR
jgi:hypothetical protein